MSSLFHQRPKVHIIKHISRQICSYIFKCWHSVYTFAYFFGVIAPNTKIFTKYFHSFLPSCQSLSSATSFHYSFSHLLRCFQTAPLVFLFFISFSYSHTFGFKQLPPHCCLTLYCRLTAGHKNMWKCIIAPTLATSHQLNGAI